MIDKYIYAVTRELPETSRKEVARELNDLITSMVDEKDAALSEKEKIDEVLRELGNPRELADRYRGKERYLIGPKYFYKYLFVMKIVVISIIIGISVAAVVGAVFSIDSLTELFGNYLISLFSAVLQGAAWVTVIFAIFEYYEVSIENGTDEETWEPSQLSALPEKKAVISRGESVFSIVISTIFLLLFFLLYERIGIYYSTGSEVSFIPLFNTEQVNPFRLLVFVIFTINIVVELIKVIKGKWTTKNAMITTVLNIISAALFIHVINNLNIWNSLFVQRFEQYVPITFDRAILLTTAVIVIVTIVESMSALYKGFKYG